MKSQDSVQTAQQVRFNPFATRTPIMTSGDRTNASKSPSPVVVIRKKQ